MKFKIKTVLLKYMNKNVLKFGIPCVALVLMIAILYFFVFHKNSNEIAPKANNDFKVGVVMPSSWFSFVDNSTIDYPQHIKDSFKASFEEEGMQDENIYIESAATLGDQAKKIDTMISRNVQAIIISPVMDESSLPDLLGLTIPNPYAMGKDTSQEKQKLINSINQAKDAGIIIGGWQNYLNDVNYDLFVHSPTAEQMGQKVGTWLDNIKLDNEKLDASEKTMEIILPEISGNNYSQDFFAGLYNQISPYIAHGIYSSKTNTINKTLTKDDYSALCLSNANGKKITTAADEQNAAHTLMNKILINNYDLSAIYNFNPDSRPDIIIAGSDQIAQGVVDSLKEKGFEPSYNSNRWPIVIGVGGLKSSIWNISNSYQAMSVIYDSNKLVQDSVGLIKELLDAKGIAKIEKGLPKMNINGKSVMTITTDPISVDKSNLKAELIDKGYITPGEAGL
ncbi:MAG: substrate-binding domain-containing protein [Bifidobacteriaceae bacterium]|jgi:ABC-type xylose transport system substrate-binding protein|nr:substrate-binding domain-containing protein [Bifidobacteriaceae bacterium]